ncbi:MAG: CHAT domain-containing protein [Saprospiraceae bacterium]|nr:CHAT domain-containing protein [Saprospiraceae bacterium]
MKQMIITLLMVACLPGVGRGQVEDSVMVAKRVDSLFAEVNALQNTGNFKDAISMAETGIALCRTSIGQNNMKYIKWLNLLGACQAQGGLYEKAESNLLKAQSVCKEVAGIANADYGQIMVNLGSLYFLTERFSLAEEALFEAKTISKQIPDNNRLLYLKSLVNLGSVYSAMGRTKDGETTLVEAKSVIETTIGKENIRYAVLLNNIANTIGVDFSRNKDAEALLLEAKDIAKRTGGPQHPQYALILSNLGRLYREMGQYEAAETNLLEVQAIREKVYGKQNDAYGKILNSLALLYHDMGRYELAQAKYLEAIPLLRKTPGEANTFYISARAGLALNYQTIGNFKAAEATYLELKPLIAENLGKESLYYSTCLNNLTSLWRSMGRYLDAKPVLLEVKSLRAINPGKNDPAYCGTLVNLGNLYLELRQPDSARAAFFEAIDIFEKMDKPQLQPFYINALASLAGLYLAEDKYVKAEALYLKSLALLEEIQGKDHDGYITQINNLGACYLKMQQFEKASKNILEAKNRCEKALGPTHEINGFILDNLVDLYLKTDHPDSAVFYLEAVSAFRQKQIIQGANHLSEREMGIYANDFTRYLDRYFSIRYLQHGFPALTELCLDNALFYKGFLLQNINRLKNLAHSDTSAAQKYEMLLSYFRRLSAEYSRPLTERKNISELEEKANNLEKDLARRVAGYGEAMQQVKWQEVQQNLKPTEAAIEFVQYQFYNKKLTDSTIYAALVLRPGWAQPRMIPLFEQRQIQPLLTAANNATTVGQLYTAQGQPQNLNKKPTRGNKEEGIVIPSEKIASLYQLIWAPIDSLLRDVTTIYYAPSGLLHRLQLSAIAVPNTNQTLADKYALVQLGSTRQLVKSGQTNPATTQTATLFGGLKYDLENPFEIPDSVVQSRPAYDVAALRSILGGTNKNDWTYLPGTEKEVESVAQTLRKANYSVHKLSGVEGSETAFKMLGKTGNPAPRVLHIATHGFFFPDPKDTTRQRENLSDREPVFKTSDNPLLRSGLVLTGANPAWAGGKTPEGQEDGILTAYEISQMNLTGTELVVLSACETGLGDVDDSEGVYGLKRAFKIAGAKYLIMSLWQVPDKQTQELMTIFYKNWLKRKMDIPKAFAAAQQTMRKRYADPFYWAGFVLVE